MISEKEVLKFTKDEENHYGSILNLNCKDMNDKQICTAFKSLSAQNTLQRLNIEFKHIDETAVNLLSVILQQNKNLQHLRLEGKLGEMGVKIITELLKQNKNLQNLYLRKSEINETGIVALMEALCQNKSLLSFTLEANRLSELGIKAVAKVLLLNTILQNLHIRGCELSGEGVNMLAMSLRQNKSLLCLDLESNKIQEKEAKMLALALLLNNSLQRLVLNYNNIGNLGAKTLAGALRQNKGLQFLELGGCKINDDGSVILAAALRQNTTLHGLNLHNNKFRKRGMDAFIKVFEENTTLKTLNLNDCLHSSGEAIALMKALRHNVGLEKLDLEGMAEETVALAESLHHNTTLLSLNLSFSSVGDIGAKALGEALSKNRTLQHLNLQSSHISNRGAAALLTSLCQNTSLQYLNLKQNTFGFEEVQAMINAVATFIRQNKSLLSLNLSENQLKQEIVLALAEALSENKSLLSLELRSVTLQEKCALALANALRLNNSLMNLDLGDNNLYKDNQTTNQNSSFAFNLQLSGVNSDGTVSESFFEVLSQNKTLLSLNLGNDNVTFPTFELGLGHQKLPFYSKILQQNSTLVHLQYTSSWENRVVVQQLNNTIKVAFKSRKDKFIAEHQKALEDNLSQMSALVVAGAESMGKHKQGEEPELFRKFKSNCQVHLHVLKFCSETLSEYEEIHSRYTTKTTEIELALRFYLVKSNCQPMLKSNALIKLLGEYLGVVKTQNLTTASLELTERALEARLEFDVNESDLSKAGPWQGGFAWLNSKSTEKGFDKADKESNTDFNAGFDFPTSGPGVDFYFGAGVTAMPPKDPNLEGNSTNSPKYPNKKARLKR